MSVTSESILRIRCSQGYQLDGKELVLCNNGSWSSPIGQCLKTCPSLVSTKTITVVCTFKNNETSKCINPPHGTIAKHVCAPFYEDLALVKNPVRVCRNGTWDSKKPECVPVCGQKAVSAQTLIINGKKSRKSKLSMARRHLPYGKQETRLQWSSDKSETYFDICTLHN
jgi:hypothetical protein